MEESETEHVHSHHAAVSHAHVVESDIPDDLGLKNVQVSQSGTFDAQLAVEKPGLVAEDVTVTEMLDVIDDAFIRVQPNPDVHQSAVLIGFNPESMTANDTGVFVHRGKDVITINHEEGIRAPDHTIEAANMQSEYNVATNHDVNAANIIKAPQLRTTRIKLYADGHTHLKIEAPIVLENGGQRQQCGQHHTHSAEPQHEEGRRCLPKLLRVGHVRDGHLRERVALSRRQAYALQQPDNQ